LFFSSSADQAHGQVNSQKHAPESDDDDEPQATIVEEYIQNHINQEPVQIAEEEIPKDLEQRFYDVDLMMNDALKSNNEAVMLENERKNDLTFHKRQNKRDYFNKRSLLKKRIQEHYQVDTDSHGYLFESSIQAHRSGAWAKRSKGKNSYTFGWDVFNDDSLYKAYNKRTS